MEKVKAIQDEYGPIFEMKKLIKFGGRKLNEHLTIIIRKTY